MNQPEGVTIDTTTGTIYVVGEPRALTVFRKKGSRARNANSGKDGFSCFMTPGKTSGAPVLRYSLPYRTSVRIEFTTLNGSWMEVFNDIVDSGDHAQSLKTPAPAAGMGFYRFSAGSFRRVVKAVSL